MKLVTTTVTNYSPDSVVLPRSAIPSATYRLQLHKAFTFNEAMLLVPYFQRLGISHLYLSPIQTARAGSLHGYDVVDHRAINPELGGEAGLLRLATACHEAGLGLIADIVPNHMAVGGADNAMWLDVLENGSASKFSNVFDIDFTPQDPNIAGKVVVPILGETYGDALVARKLSLLWDQALGKLAFAYGPHRLPLRPQDYPLVAGDQHPASIDLTRWQPPTVLHDLLEQQNFRLAWWNAAGDIINWRRFFDVNELVGLQMENESVFNLTHEIILRLYGDGILDGVRVDHVDGLANPTAYLIRLRNALDSRTAHRPAASPLDGPYIVVEKILARDEALPSDWPVDGTTGYDFMDQVSALQHDPSGAPTLDTVWADISGRPNSFNTEETQARIEVLRGGFAGQLAACAREFAELARTEVSTRDLTAESFRRALVMFIANLRRYRTYATGGGHQTVLDPAFQLAISEAKASIPADTAALDFLSAVLTDGSPSHEVSAELAVQRLNQLTAPVAAKAVEDTAFYRYSRLVSRNDVGFDANRLAMSTEEFLRDGEVRATTRGNAMLTTATHDHKRGEDVRARLAVISELSDLWGKTVMQWFEMTADGRPEVIAGDDAYALFQTLAGCWPLCLKSNDAAGLADLSSRLVAWRQKSLREAKLRSSWAAPDAAYEEANAEWIKTLLDPSKSAGLLASIAQFVARISPAGAVNGIVQAALRCTWPGIPDIYQGAELWDFSLVDPDNRRPVDFALRRELLEAPAQDWTSGAIKQSIIARILQWRRSEPTLFTKGTLARLPIRGTKSGHVLAFRRCHGRSKIDVAVMLHVADSITSLGELPKSSWWSDTSVLTNGAWHNAAELFHSEPIYAVPGT